MKKLCQCWLIAVLFFTGLLLSARPADWQTPDVNPFREPISKSRWLWFQAPKVGSRTTAYYRMNIELDEPVKSAWIYAIFDDNGDAKLNGQPLKEITIVQPDAPIRTHRYEPEPGKWRIGRNTLSVTANNGEAMGGTIIRGEITLESGKVIKLYSTAATVKAADKSKALQNWRNHDFDDSSWQDAMELGDANIEPWKSVSAVMSFFLDEEDQQNYDALMNRITDISFLKDEPDWKGSIVWNNDAAGIAINGEPTPPMVYLVGGNPWIPQVANDVIKAGLAGVKFMEYQSRTTGMFYQKSNKRWHYGYRFPCTF